MKETALYFTDAGHLADFLKAARPKRFHLHGTGRIVTGPFSPFEVEIALLYNAVVVSPPAPSQNPLGPIFTKRTIGRRTTEPWLFLFAFAVLVTLLYIGVS